MPIILRDIGLQTVAAITTKEANNGTENPRARYRNKP
jgi:hypothetical protein